MSQAAILSADAWNMVDEKTSAAMSGTSVWFVNPYDKGATPKPGSFGYKPSKVGCTAEVLEQLQAKGVVLPALFEMFYDSRPGAQGKASLVLAAVKFVRNLPLFGEAK